MKISELMERLGELQGQYGDLEIHCFDSDGDIIPPDPEYWKDDDGIEWVVL